MSTVFTIGQRWISHSEPQLGLGIVSQIEGRSVTISYPAAAQTRRYASDSDALSRVEYQIGDHVTNNDEQKLTVVNRQENQGLIIYNCIDEQNQSLVLPEIELSCFVTFTSPTQRLFNLQFDSANTFQLRLLTFELMDRLQRSDASGLLGSRTSLLPHQIYITHEVGKRFAPRVLLADEVGLGKTIEAGMIIHQQIHLGLASRILIVVPPSLIHQWLVEMLRRFNLHFSIFDRERIENIKKGSQLEDGDEDEVESLVFDQVLDTSDDQYNPFEAEQLIICDLNLLTDNPQYLEDIKSAGFDLLIVDEVHHLSWTPTKSSLEYDCISQLTQSCPGAVLLTATPESSGIESYFAQLALLDASRFYDLELFKKQQTSYSTLNDLVQQLLSYKTSLEHGDSDQLTIKALKQELESYLPDVATKSSVIDSSMITRWIDQLIDRHGTSRVLFRNTREVIGGFPKRELNFYCLDCPLQYQQLGPLELLYPETKMINSEWWKVDPRVSWLEEFLKRNRSDKVLLICAHMQTAIELEHYLHLTKGIASTAFHENLTIIERDRAAAYFADQDNGAQLLICSEIGSEGRNFQYAHHLVLFDLPLNPDLLEQRIGRLDRIGQTETIQIHVPYLANTAQEAIFRWYNDGLGQFTQTFSSGRKVFEQSRSEFFDFIQNWPSNSRQVETFIATTRKYVDELKGQALVGKDKLLELNSCRKDIAEKIISEIVEFESADLLDGYLEKIFDEFNIDYQEHSTNALIIEPTETMPMDVFPGLKSGQMTITTNRQLALVREDMEFLSFEHPMLEEVMGIIIEGEIGNATISSLALKNIRPGKVFVEAFYVVECLTPKQLQLYRFLPLSPLRIVLDEKYKEITELMNHEKLNQFCKNVDKKTAQVVIPHVRSKVEKILQHAKTLNQKHLNNLKSNAIREHQNYLNDEVNRLTALKKVNSSIRQDEIDFINDQIEQGREYLERSTLKLQAIRVIVSV